MAPCPSGPRNRLNIDKMKKTFDIKMECFNYRLEKWSEVLKQPVFTFKTKDKYEDTYDVMSVEKYFDYLMDIHVIHTDHGDVKTMMEAIQEEGLWLPYEALYVFHRVCSKCSVMRRTQIKKDYARRTHQMNISDENYRTRGFVEIIDMTSKPDGEYKYILLYRDLGTRFTRMRALKNPFALEVADELFEIFMTSGAPAILHTPVSRTFTEAIIKNLETLMPDIKILIGNRKASRKKADKIIELVDKWLANNNMHWNMGIHYVAAEMNNNKKPSMLSPFEALYNKKPGTGLIKRFSNPASRTLFKKLQNVEDLLLPSVDKYVMSASEDLSILSSSGEELMLTEWCAVCGKDDADTFCEQCGVAIHLKCNTDNEKVCDCCMLNISEHEHNSLLQKSINTSGTVTQLDNVVEMENVDKTGAPPAKIVKTSVKLPVLAHPVKVLTAKNVPSTSAEPNNMDNLTDDKTELKVGKIIGQYKKRKKPIAKDCTTQLGEVQNNTDDAVQVRVEAVDVRNKEIELESVNVTYVVIEIANEPISIKNEPVDIQNEPVDVKNEPVEIKIEPVEIKIEPVDVKDEPIDVKYEPVYVKDEPVDIKDEPVDVKNESINVGNKYVKVRDDAVDVNQEVETINVFDEELDIVKNEPY